MWSLQTPSVLRHMPRQHWLRLCFGHADHLFDSDFEQRMLGALAGSANSRPALAHANPWEVRGDRHPDSTNPAAVRSPARPGSGGYA